MSGWKGLDPGGTEQLWEPEVLYDMLLVLKTHEPFSRNDPKSAIYTDLQEQYPQITWHNTNADGSFRPIFRKANPLIRLGLTTPEAENGTVTNLGNDFLSGIVSVQEIFSLAAKNHREPDGTPSMSLMCASALEIPDIIFRLEDIEFGISDDYDPTKKNAADILNRVRREKIEFPENSGVRKRRLRNFMGALVTANAFISVENGWKLKNFGVAKEIASELYSESTPSIGEVKDIVKKGKFNSIIKELSGEEYKSISVNASSKAGDPEKRALLLERANNIHQSIVQALSKIILEIGLKPTEGVNSFDVGIIGDSEAIIEVKSITQKNCTSQLRKAVAQLPEYRWRHRDIYSERVHLIIALNDDPRQFIDQDYYEYLTTDRNLLLIWQQDDSFVGSDGRTFQEILIPH